VGLDVIGFGPAHTMDEADPRSDPTARALIAVRWAAGVTEPTQWGCSLPLPIAPSSA
jgi:hypothetical protein